MIQRALENGVQIYTNIIMKYAIVTLLVLSIITISLLKAAITFEENMTRDIEVYLPDGEESTTILIEVRKDWATDIIIVYVETPNARNPDYFSDPEVDNITYVPTLLEIALLEETIDYYGQRADLAKYQADRGTEDHIIFTLSISTLIKEFNSTNARFLEASEKKAFGGLSIDDDAINQTGTYEIPNYSDQRRSQDRVDQIYDSTASALQNFAIDTNDDGIIDTAVILFALRAEDEGNDEVQEEMIAKIQQHIDNRYCPQTDYCTDMTQTGLVVVLHEVTARLYDDLLTMLPISLGIVVGLMLLFHRNWLAIPVVLVPIFCALIWTLGIISLSGVVLTPMIVAAGPILVGIGVDYGLHVANRIVEFKNEIDETEENKMPRATFLALMTTGKATLLCAITDTIGFSALFISPIAPMRTVGLTMIVGVACAFFLTVSMTPAMMKLTNYSRHKSEGWTSIAIFSTKQWKAILVVVILTTTYSIARISVMDQDIKGNESAPEDIESIKKLGEYSDEFEAGQTGILLINGPPDRPKPAAKDLDVLDIMNWTQGEINDISINNRNNNDLINVSAFSIVDFFKSAHISFTIEDLGGDPIFVYDGTFWEFLHSDFFGENYTWVDLNPVYSRENLRSDMIDVFYESFTDEMRSMLLTDEYDKALIYVSMPYVNIDDTTIIVDKIDEIAYIRDIEMHAQDAKMSQLTGGPPVTIAINKGIQNTQFDTIVLSLILVLITLMIIFKSPKFGAITFLPIFLVILWYPATVDAGGTNLNIFTAMVGTIIIGIGIDNSIQVTERVREEGATPEGIQKAVEHTGQSVVEATFTTMGGVLAGVIISLYRTQFVGLRNFFGLIITLILFSLLMAVFALPSFYHALHYLKQKYAERNWNIKERIRTRFN